MADKPLSESTADVATRADGGATRDPDPASQARLQGVVLVVEDHAEVRHMLRRLLERRGYAVVTASDGEEGLALLLNAVFDVCITDIAMPRLDGLAFVERVRSFERESGRRRIPIIAFTSHFLPTDRERAHRAGVDAYMTKPSNTTALLDEVQRLAQRSALAEILEDFERHTYEPAVAAELTDMIPDYLQSRRREIEALRAQGEHVVHPDAADIGHKLKGTGATFGFAGLTELGGLLERAAEARDAVAIAMIAATTLQHLQRLSTCFCRVVPTTSP